jgi:hypothetical protein
MFAAAMRAQSEAGGQHVEQQREQTLAQRWSAAGTKLWGARAGEKQMRG